jgi:hypothetical protein
MKSAPGPRAAKLAGLAIALVAVVLATGCADRARPIPSGAQIVHVTVTPTEVRLVPATVRAGDVYLVLDEPPSGSLFFVASQHTASATPGPLNVAQLARLSNGDTIGTHIESVDSGHCDPSQNAAARGMVGPCGNAARFVVLPGPYAIFGDAPDADRATGDPPPMAILEVSP